MKRSEVDLADVAATYKCDLYGGGYPKQAVAKTYDVTLGTASRWIREARDAGLIAEHEKGRPGFVPSAPSRKRALVLDAAETVVKEWRLNGSSFELGDLLHDLARAVES